MTDAPDNPAAWVEEPATWADEPFDALVSRLSDILGPDTDFDNYTFSIRRGSLRRLLAARKAKP